MMNQYASMKPLFNYHYWCYINKLEPDLLNCRLDIVHLNIVINTLLRFNIT